MFLAYLQKVGPKLATYVQKDVRAWCGPDGRETSRRVATRDEARKVLRGLEAIVVSGNALIPSYSMLRGKGDEGGKSGFKGGGKP